MSDDTARENWDTDYQRKGRLYGGTPPTIPPLPPGSRVLELGCGNGRLLTAMLHRDWLVSAIDFSPRAAILARSVACEGSGADIAIADATALPFRSGSFDGIAAYHILGHGKIPDRTAIAREIIRLLSPGGQLWFADFSTNDFRYGSGSPVEPGTFLRGNGVQTHYFTETEVEGIFSGLLKESLRRDEWMLRVRGRDHRRSEISAVFKKPGR